VRWCINDTAGASTTRLVRWCINDTAGGSTTQINDTAGASTTRLVHQRHGWCINATAVVRQRHS
jgi:adenosine/AMP kinase